MPNTFVVHLALGVDENESPLSIQPVPPGGLRGDQFKADALQLLFWMLRSLPSGTIEELFALIRGNSDADMNRLFREWKSQRHVPLTAPDDDWVEF